MCKAEALQPTEATAAKMDTIQLKRLKDNSENVDNVLV